MQSNCGKIIQSMTWKERAREGRQEGNLGKSVLDCNEKDEQSPRAKFTRQRNLQLPRNKTTLTSQLNSVFLCWQWSMESMASVQTHQWISVQQLESLVNYTSCMKSTLMAATRGMGLAGVLSLFLET